MQTIDTLISARWVIPVEPLGTVLDHHSIAIQADRIIDILPAEQAQSRYQARTSVDFQHGALIPGLINLHGHAAMSLLRGLADDKPLMAWLQQHIWPAEIKHVRDDFVFDGTQLAIAEMLRGGTTCFNDMYFFPAACARAALATNIRAVIGATILEFPTAYANDADDYLNKGLAARDQFLGEPLLAFTLAPHAPFTISDRTFEKVVTLAEQLQLPIHTHIHETQAEIDDSLKQHHIRPLARIKALGLLSPALIGVHMVHLTPGEIALLAEHGCHIAHNPSSNMKLASGIAPIAQLNEAGINIGLGTDGAASNNRLDMFTEMRTAALLAKVATGKADVLPAQQALAMATLSGARALGLDEEIGSLRIGKQADIVAVDLSSVETAPCFDPISHLVYAAGREQVTDVWIAGRQVLGGRELLTANRAQIVAKSHWWRDKICGS